MNTSKMTAKEYFKGLNIIYYSFIAGAAMLLLFALFMDIGTNITPDDDFFVNTLTIVFLAFLIIGIIGGHLFFYHRLKNINKDINDLFVKTAHYRSIVIIRYAGIESPAFFASIAYLLTNSMLFIILGVMCIVYMLVLRPSKERLIAELQLDNAEKDKIYDPGAIISEMNL